MDSYNLILVIIDQLIKIVYFKLLKIIINLFRLAKVIIKVLVYHNSFLNFIMINKSSFFISKFWSFFWNYSITPNNSFIYIFYISLLKKNNLKQEQVYKKYKYFVSNL